MKIFVDTNIFLDLILKRDRFREATVIFNAIEKRAFVGVILDITVLNIDYIAKKQIKDLREFLILVNLVFEIIGGSNEMVKSALEIDNSDLEDNLQYISAKKSKCDLIISNDKDFYSGSIDVVSSLEFVKRYLS